MELFDLEQLAAFADYGTLSSAADKLHLSQPTLTKTMKRLEEEFQVPLFIRTKNKLELNENGKLAAKKAHEILASSKEIQIWSPGCKTKNIASLFSHTSLIRRIML